MKIIQEGDPAKRWHSERKCGECGCVFLIQTSDIITDDNDEWTGAPPEQHCICPWCGKVVIVPNLEWIAYMRSQNPYCS